MAPLQQGLHLLFSRGFAVQLLAAQLLPLLRLYAMLSCASCACLVPLLLALLPLLPRAACLALGLRLPWLCPHPDLVLLLLVRPVLAAHLSSAAAGPARQ